LKRDPWSRCSSGEESFVRFLVNNNSHPSPVFFVSVASKGLNVSVSRLESTLASIPISVDSKGTYAALKLCKMGLLRIALSYAFILKGL
jgi:hypothetical protein